MKRIDNLVIIALICLSGMASCSNNNPYKRESIPDSQVSMTNIPTEGKEVADRAFEEVIPNQPQESFNPVSPAVVPNFVASSAALAYNDGVHKFIRTAQTKFKVLDVVSATSTIEDIALRNKGFILNSTISNNNLSSQTINISADSALVNYLYNLNVTVSIKVPASSLDTVLREIAPLAILVDYRTINAEDVTVKLMTDQLAQVRLNKKQKRLSGVIASGEGKLEDRMNAEESLDATLEQADRRIISEYVINEQIAYSTIQITLYQDPIRYTEKVLRETVIEGYTPGLGTELKEAFISGWSALSVLFVFLVNIWPILIILIVSAIIYIKVRKQKRGDNN